MLQYKFTTFTDSPPINHVCRDNCLPTNARPATLKRGTTGYVSGTREKHRLHSSAGQNKWGENSSLCLKFDGLFPPLSRSHCSCTTQYIVVGQNRSRALSLKFVSPAHMTRMRCIMVHQ